MKKVFFAVATVAAFGLASCSSEKDCECVTTSDGTEVGTTTTTIEDGECEDMESSTTTMGMTTETTCEEV